MHFIRKICKEVNMKGYTIKIIKCVFFARSFLLLFNNQGYQFSGKILNSGPGNLFSGLMFQFFVYKLNNVR